jgi:hypothetical protein
MRHRFAGHVAHRHGGIAIGGAPTGDELVGEPAGLAVLSKNAGVDLKQVFHEFLRFMGNCIKLFNEQIKQ